MSELKEQIEVFGRRARLAARLLAKLSRAEKDLGLLAMAEEIEATAPEILR